MRREIDILVKAAGKRCAVVEKASRQPWTLERLAQAREAGRFREQTDLAPPDSRAELVGVFWDGGQPYEAPRPVDYRPIGQTRHFVIFAALDGAPDRGARAEG